MIPINTKVWRDLKHHFHDIKDIHLVDLFQEDSNRFKKFSLFFKEKILIDFSKHRITSKTINMLIQLAKEMKLNTLISDMFNGKKINFTENCSVLHTALRNRSNTPIFINNYNIMIQINSVLNKMQSFSDAVISGQWKGYSGKKITNIVNIGIGGSHLGPKMVTEALKPYKNHLNINYISNIDSTDVYYVLKKCNFESTIFLISSKSFSTRETMTNANTIKKYFLNQVHHIKYMKNHFFAITTNIPAALDFGVEKDNIFELWNWVGGRYSLWSAMGLSIVLSIGFDNFNQLLHGAYDMDMHFKNTEFENNIPVLLGLIGIWYNNFFHTETEAILPYDQYLHEFPRYIQQSNMESNGKNIDQNGNKISWQTGPIIWGEVGTNGQHSFYQLMHQGTKLIPCDFIAPIVSHNAIGDHHTILLSNFFAQTNALAFGKYFIEDKKKIFQPNILDNINNFFEKFKNFEGNRPTTSILIRKIDPYSLGVLIALYEHKIFTQGVIFNICSFDQWGVELGKNLCDSIFDDLYCNKKKINYDSSTQGLIDFYNYCKKYN